MKYIGTTTVNDIATLQVHECDCGFHIGMDATYLEQVGNIVTQCPSCKTVLKIK